MLLDSKGKLFGKISVVDVLVVLIIIICAVGVYMRLQGSAGRTAAENTEFIYTVEFKEMRPSTVAVLEHAIGTKFKLEEKGRADDMGTLISYEMSPARDYLTMANGMVVFAEMPERYDAVLTFKLSGKVNERGFFTPQLKAIGAGSTVMVSSKWFSGQGEILGVYLAE